MVRINGLFHLSPKDPFVCPNRKGLGPLHSYSIRMGLEPEKSYSREGSGFLGIYKWDI